MKKIGITAFYQKSGMRRMSLVDRQYVEAIIAQGALPVIIPTTPNYDLAKEYISEVDGLLITGGCDVSPLYYNEEPGVHTTSFSMERDLFEEALIKAAIAKHIPIMGVCRGTQIINCALGGNLIQHIPSDVKDPLCLSLEDDEQWEAAHTVKISPDSYLYPIFGEKAVVNSYHHQAVNRLGEGLKATAYSPDGLCEAYEDKERKILAVQWHPEKMYHHDEKQNAIFKTFVDLA